MVRLLARDQFADAGRVYASHVCKVEQDVTLFVLQECVHAFSEFNLALSDYDVTREIEDYHGVVLSFGDRHGATSCVAAAASRPS